MNITVPNITVPEVRMVAPLAVEALFRARLKVQEVTMVGEPKAFRD